jgi:RNA polymerase sigma factor (sigma-70 family)
MSDDDAGDVFQGAFLALHGSLQTIRTAQALPKWLAVAAARECHRVRRRNARTVGGADLILDAAVDESPRADEQAEGAVDTFLVRRGLADLGGKCRDLLERLYFADDSDYAVISAELGMPIGSIGPTRARCLEKLRKLLEKSGFFGGDVSNAMAASSEVQL